MGFADISKAIGTNGSGHQEFEQGELIRRFTPEEARGVCHGHVVNWLIARYDREDYVGGSHFRERKESTPILAESKTATYGKLSQDFEAGEWRENLDRKLAGKDMTFAQAKMRECAFMGPGSLKGSVSDSVLTDTPRYFYLFIHGTRGAHAIGIHRPYAYIGKSSKSEVFDPNFGEFSLKNSTGLQAALVAIEMEYGRRVAEGFELRPYTGNGW